MSPFKDKVAVISLSNILRGLFIQRITADYIAQFHRLNISTKPTWLSSHLVRMLSLLCTMLFYLYNYLDHFTLLYLNVI